MGQKISEMTSVGAGALGTDELELSRSSSSSSFRLALSALATYVRTVAAALTGTTLTLTGDAAVGGNLTVTGSINNGGTGLSFGSYTVSLDVGGSAVSAAAVSLPRVDASSTGAGFTGILFVSNTVTANAGTRTQKVYAVLGRGTTCTFTQLATADGETAGASFTMSCPSAGVLRLTNTSGVTTTVRMTFLGNIAI